MDAETLRLAVIADPDDDGPRLAYSDLIEEGGDHARAEFIRVQCALASMAEDDDRRFDLEDREARLSLAHRERWIMEDLPELIRTSWPNPDPEEFQFGYRRGFLETIRGSAAHLLARARVLSRRIPFRDLDTYYRPEGRGLRLSSVLADWPFPIPLDRLRLVDTGWDASAVEELCGFSCLSRLTSLELVHEDDSYRDWATLSGWLGPPLERRALQAMARSPHLAGLKRLGFDGISLGPSARALLDSPNLSRLEHLRILGVFTPALPVREIFGSPGAARLTALDLMGGRIGSEGLRELVSSPHLIGLRRLELAVNGLDDVALADLARWPGLAGLRVLDLTYNQIGDAGLRELADSPYADRLESLRLASNFHLGDEGVRALAASPHLGRLRRLDLDQSAYHDHPAIGNASILALAASPHLTSLRDLNLGQTFRLDDVGAEALASSPNLASLLRLGCGSASGLAIDRLKARFGDRVFRRRWES